MKCLGCGKQFKISSNSQKYCSSKCRNVQPKRKEYMKNWQRKNWQNNILKKYDKKDLIECKICGGLFRQVGSHVVQAHGYDRARQYRKEFGFDVKKGQLPPDYEALKRDKVFQNGTVNNLKKGQKYWFKKGDKNIGKYTRSQETMMRLKKLHKTRKVV